jgi:hypothetical protein
VAITTHVSYIPCSISASRFWISPINISKPPALSKWRSTRHQLRFNRLSVIWLAVQHLSQYDKIRHGSDLISVFSIQSLLKRPAFTQVQPHYSELLHQISTDFIQSLATLTNAITMSSMLDIGPYFRARGTVLVLDYLVLDYLVLDYLVLDYPVLRPDKSEPSNPPPSSPPIRDPWAKPPEIPFSV